jgi:hypothetical protein
VASTLSTLAVVGGSEPYAFAGWSASPTVPANGQLSSADAVCQARLAQAAELAPSNKGSVVISGMVPELSDVRGPYTVTVFSEDRQSGVLCLSYPSGVSLRWIMRSTPPPGPGAIAVDQVSVLARDSQPYTLVEGRAGAGVTGVTLTLGNGDTVTTTSGNGLFIAWWPGSQTIASAVVSTATGVSTQTLDLPGPSIPPTPGTKSSPVPPGTPSSSSDPSVFHS